MVGISHRTTDQAAMESSIKTIFKRCMQALNIILPFILGYTCICANQNNKSSFSSSFFDDFNDHMARKFDLRNVP